VVAEASLILAVVSVDIASVVVVSVLLSPQDVNISTEAEAIIIHDRIFFFIKIFCLVKLN
jgi:hypothetical protein